jgi:hypothetical protein
MLSALVVPLIAVVWLTLMALVLAACKLAARADAASGSRSEDVAVGHDLSRDELDTGAQAMWMTMLRNARRPGGTETQNERAPARTETSNHAIVSA